MWFSGKQKKSRPLTRSGLYKGLGGSTDSSRLATAQYEAKGNAGNQMELAKRTAGVPCLLEVI